MTRAILPSAWKRFALLGALVVAGIAALLAIPNAGADEPSADVPASADTYLRRGNPNTNEGASTFLRVRATGDNRALVRFDEAVIQDAIGGETLLTATLQLTILETPSGWGPNGREVALHRLTQDWAEGNGFVYCNSDDWLAHPGTVGRALVGTIHIVGDDGEELPVGEPGTVQIGHRVQRAEQRLPDPVGRRPGLRAGRCGQPAAAVGAGDDPGHGASLSTIRRYCTSLGSPLQSELFQAHQYPPHRQNVARYNEDLRCATSSLARPERFHRST